MSGLSQGYDEPQTGATVDRRYAIKREIARGAMGVVFEATHVTLRTSVALKTLTRSALEWAAGHPRLMREARILSVCKHAAVVRVYDAGVCPTHGPYIALEMIDGRSLESYLVAREQLDIATVAHIGEQLASALAHVHERGIVHRDIKPANVLVTRDAGKSGDSLRLIDFGIACVPEEADVVARKLTGHGELLGTVEYMAPEVLLQEQPSSAASDVYALGVVLYECLTGVIPFPGRPMVVMTAHASGAPARPITELRADVPPLLANAIMSALAPSPTARLASAALFARACAQVRASSTSVLSLLDAEPAPAIGQARRQFPRAPYSAPARIVTAAGSVDGRTEDISEGGTLIVVSAECAQGERVSVRFPLPSSGRIVAVDGIARWTKSQRGQRAVGVGFAQLPEEARLDIQRFAEIMSSDRLRDPLAQTMWKATPGGPSA